jgi:AraC family transcriptional regulator, transcriptional activator of pobA
MFYTYTIAEFFDKPPQLQHFHINRIEAMPPLPASIKSPHKHLFYEVLLVKAGTMIHNVDYQEYTIEADTLFFISQGQLHLWGKTNIGSIEGYRLMFTEDFFEVGQSGHSFLFELIYLDNVYQTPQLSVSASSRQIFDYFELMHQEFGRSDCNLQALRSLLFLVLTETQRIANSQRGKLPNRQQMLIYKQFMQLLEAHFTDKWGVDHYAERLNTTPRQLNRILQEVAQQSFMGIIQNRLVLEAKRMLILTTLSVSQIADHLGFDDSSYFSRFFRRHTQITPLDFRQNTA